MKKILFIALIITFLFTEFILAQPKSVTLTWINSVTPDVAGYNLFRADVTNGDYVKVNTALIPSDPSGTGEYTDESVNYAHRYFWVCRAVVEWEDPFTGEAGELESINSNEATAFMMPPAPVAPKGLIKKSLTP